MKDAVKTGDIVAHATVRKAMRVLDVKGKNAQCAWPVGNYSNLRWFPTAELAIQRGGPIKVWMGN